MPEPAGAVGLPPTHVVLVDEDDRATGVSEKVAAHRAPGLRHRALSAFVFDGTGRLLLQRRAAGKYHFAGLWSNSCCTHPGPDEAVVAAGERRVREELGLRCQLVDVGTFTYRALDETSGLVEHEVDHVLVGRCTQPPVPDPAEVGDVVRLSLPDLRAALRRAPHRFTPWLPAALATLEQADLTPWTRPPPWPGTTPGSPDRPHAEERS